jgi:hypothetical protein
MVVPPAKATELIHSTTGAISILKFDAIKRRLDSDKNPGELRNTRPLLRRPNRGGGYVFGMWRASCRISRQTSAISPVSRNDKTHMNGAEHRWANPDNSFSSVRPIAKQLHHGGVAIIGVDAARNSLAQLGQNFFEKLPTIAPIVRESPDQMQQASSCCFCWV